MAERAVGSEAWIRIFHPAPKAALRLVCFPHAGGSASFYFPFSAGLHPDVEVLAVQYPGRQDRRDEPPATDVRALADGVADALRPWYGEPLAFFGHSMGALVAFEVCRSLERSTGVEPVVMIASGMRAPSRRHVGEPTSSDRDDLKAVIADLARLNGTDVKTLEENEDFVRLLVPVLEADYTAMNSYHSPPEAELRCPITVFIGDSDPFIPLDTAQAWCDHTSGGLDLHVFAGDHFYLSSLRAATLSRLSEVLWATYNCR